MSNDLHTQLHSHIDVEIHSRSYQCGAGMHKGHACMALDHCWAYKVDGVSENKE